MNVSVSPSHIAAQALAAQSRLATPQREPAAPVGFQALALKSVQASKAIAVAPVEPKPVQTPASFATMPREDNAQPASEHRPVRPGTNLDIRV